MKRAVVDDGEKIEYDVVQGEKKKAERALTQQEEIEKDNWGKGGGR